MDTVKARNIIREATRLVIPKLQKGFGDARVKEAYNNGGLTNDIRSVLRVMRHGPSNPHYQRFEVFMPNTIPFGEFEEAMSTIKTKSLHTGIKMGIKDILGKA